MANGVTDSMAGGSGRLIGLVSVAHFFSHFYLLILPALLPILTTVLSG